MHQIYCLNTMNIEYEGKGNYLHNAVKFVNPKAFPLRCLPLLSLLQFIYYVSVNSKPDHPQGKPPGNCFERANSHPPEQRKCETLTPGAEKCAENPSSGGNYFQKSIKNMRETVLKC